MHLISQLISIVSIYLVIVLGILTLAWVNITFSHYVIQKYLDLKDYRKQFWDFIKYKKQKDRTKV